MFKKSVNEEEFKSVIGVLEQRLHFMEQKNALLEQQIRKLEIANNNLLQQHINDNSKLERRITDFTDVWHPMMMDNISRIKDELVEQVKDKSEDLLQTYKKQIPNNLSNYVLVGFNIANGGSYIPCFAYKPSTWNDLYGTLVRSSFTTSHRSNSSFIIILESLSLLNLDNIDLDMSILISVKINIYYKNKELINYNDLNMQNTNIPDRTKLLFNKPGIKTIYRFCNEHNIKLVFNGQEYINGVPIKTLIEQNPHEY